MKASGSIFVSGHNGMVGSAILRHLNANGVTNIVTADRQSLDLSSQGAVRDFFASHNISMVYLAAARVGGIHANNTYPAEFIYQNLMIQNNLIHEAWQAGVKRLVFLGSSCIYPKSVAQPMAESALLTGKLEATNEPYAIAKIAGIKMCESYNRQYGTDFRSVMPTNLYGQGDNFHPDNSHVIPALMARFHQARTENWPRVVVWGSGKPRREFLHVDEMAAATVYIANLSHETYSSCTQEMCSHINVGSGIDYSIRELAEILATVIGYSGDLEFDDSKPDGTPRKLMDVSRLARLGWKAQISLEEGLKKTYRWYLGNQQNVRS